MKSIKEKVREAAEAEGCAAFGVADLDELVKAKPDLFENFQQSYPRAAVMGVRLQDAVLEEIEDRPTPLYFHNYRQANSRLDRLGWMVADFLQSAGYRAVAVPASQFIRRNPMSGHISHRLLGVHAGIGFLGRSNLLVHPVYGARMRYVSVLTDAELEPDKPYAGPGCGDCRACVDECPAGAIRDCSEDFDKEACLAKLTQFTSISYVGQYICGVCVKACRGAAVEKG